MNSEINYVSPFKKFCITIGNLPTSYLESMSYYDSLTYLVNYLANNVIPALNNNGEVVEELQNQFTMLKNYVDTYFDNLDVQEEINNKLDEMAESGQLTDIIAQYLGLAGMITFDTVAEMKAAENLVNGSKCCTLGFHNVNDGGNAFYKVRTITNDDVIDEVFIIELQDQYLIAELIVNDDLTPEMLGCYGDGIEDDTSKLQYAINNTKKLNANKIYNITSVTLNDIEFNLNGVINGRVILRKNVKLNGGEIHGKTDDAVIEIANNIANPRNMNTIIDGVKIFPTTNGIGIYANATDYSLFNFIIQNCDIDSGNIGIKFENNNSNWITKCDINNVFLHSPNIAIKINNTTNNIANMADFVFRNVYAQYYNHKPEYFIDANLTRIYLENSFCYDGIETAVFNVTDTNSKINVLDGVQYDNKTLSINTDPEVLLISKIQNSDGGSILRTNRNITYLPKFRNGQINPTVSGSTGSYPFIGFIGKAGDNVSNQSKYSAINFWNGRLSIGYSDTTTPADFTMYEINTPMAGQVFTTSTLPTGVRNGATCWCSDILMSVTYYNTHWYKPDGTQLI